MNSLVVYNAPNDFTGQTELDEYAAIAQAEPGLDPSARAGRSARTT